MCIPALAALAAGGTGAATAAGATAAATAAGSTLQTLGLIASVGGSLYSGMSAMQMGKAQAAQIEAQRVTERNLNATKDHRASLQFAKQIRQQAADLAARGFDLGSPTAVLLGQEAAQEMAFNSQAIRSEGQARDAELSASARIARSQATKSMITGTVGAAGKFITAAPDIWPELLK